MWPFEDSLRDQNPIRKYREWLKRWLFKNNQLNTVALIGFVLSLSLLSAYLFYSWHNQPNTSPAITSPPAVQKTESRQDQPVSEQNTSVIQEPLEKAVVQTPVNPEEMVKPVMGHALTGVGMSFSEVFQDYRYNSGVALAANPGAEIKTALPGTVSLVTTAENGTQQVTVNHGDGWETIYSGLEQVVVKAGEKLSRDAVIGTLGAYHRVNGINENHLFFKVTKDGEPVDPNTYWK